MYQEQKILAGDELRTWGVVLSGGEGSRLFSLTNDRAKPAVPIFGSMRMIDIILSMCHVSGIDNVDIMVQYEPISLTNHIGSGEYWDFDNRNINIYPPLVKRTKKGDVKFKGTADAVRPAVRKMKQVGTDVVVILSGDHVYFEDFRPVIKKHHEEKIDATIYVKAVPTVKAMKALGVMKVSDHGTIIDFKEKPQTMSEMKPFIISEKEKEKRGIEEEEDMVFASMGIYLFNPKEMYRQLNLGGDDFGHEVIPRMVKDRECVVAAEVFKGYWEDVGQLATYIDVNFHAIDNLDRMINTDYILTNPRMLPPARGSWNHCIVSPGCVNEGTVTDSVIGYQNIIQKTAIVTKSFLFGGDRHFVTKNRLIAKKNNVVISSGVVLDGVVLDKNITIPRNVHLSSNVKPSTIRRKLESIGLIENDGKENNMGDFNIVEGIDRKYLVFGKLQEDRLEELGRDFLFPEGFKL